MDKLKKIVISDRIEFYNNEILIGEDNELGYSLAKCCLPIPGDDIFGFITIGRIYRYFSSD